RIYLDCSGSHRPLNEVLRRMSVEPFIFFSGGQPDWNPDPGRLVRPVKEFAGSTGPAPRFFVPSTPAGSSGRGREVPGERCGLAWELLHRPDEPAGVGSPALFATLVFFETL